MLLRTCPSAPTGARSAVPATLAAVVLRTTPAHLAVGRTAAGASMVVRPKALPQLMGLDSATATRVGWSVQMLGIRDLALGLGTLVALRNPDPRAARSWLAMGVLCDAVDALAVTGAMVKGRVSKGSGAAVVAVALGAAAIGAQALQGDEADA